MDEPRVRTYDRHGEPHDDVLRTKTGRVVTEEELAAWAEEAAQVDGAEVTVDVTDEPPPGRMGGPGPGSYHWA